MHPASSRAGITIESNESGRAGPGGKLLEIALAMRRFRKLWYLTDEERQAHYG